MTLLQFIIIISALVFILFGFDLYKRKKANLLHVLIFLGGGAVIILFSFNQSLLNKFGKYFGTARGVDIFVYAGIILLFYFYIEMLNQHTKSKFQLTRLISQTAINDCYRKNKTRIQSYVNSSEKDDFIFNIRVYNEGKVVGETIDDVLAAGFKKILLVNDGSSDISLDVLEEKEAQYPEALIMIASHTINRGGGAANQTGYNFIKKYGDELKIKRFVGFDADGQMTVNDMDTFMKTMKNHPADLYLGSRFLEDSKTENMAFSRKIILFLSRVITRVFYHSHVSDPHIGYRVISLASLRKIVLTADGMHYANEVNEQIHKYKMKYVEVPVYIRYTEHSTTKAHRQKNSHSIKLAMEMIYKKIFFR